MTVVVVFSVRIFCVEVVVVAETRDSDHASQMKDMIQSKYDNITITGVGGALGLTDEDEVDRREEQRGKPFTTLTIVQENQDECSISSRSGSVCVEDEVIGFGGLSVPVITSARRGSIRMAVGTLST